MRAILTVLLVILLLFGCGLKDDLYLPEPEQQPESSDSASERDDEENT